MTKVAPASTASSRSRSAPPVMSIGSAVSISATTLGHVDVEAAPVCRQADAGLAPRDMASGVVSAQTSCARLKHTKSITETCRSRAPESRLTAFAAVKEVLNTTGVQTDLRTAVAATMAAAGRGADDAGV
jgi:hypothetical protein